MNILIIGDRPQDQGLHLLKGVVKDKWPNAKVVVLEPTTSQTRSSLSTSGRDLTAVLLTDLGKLDTNHYSLDATPVDLVDLAHMRHDLFLPPGGSWNLVLTGVALGPATGIDVLKAGHTCAAMWASLAYKTTAIAFGQEGDSFPNHTSSVLADFLREAPVETDSAWNMSIPKGQPLGYKSVSTAHYSPTRMPSTQVVPRAREEQSDVTLLAKGFVTLTLMELRTNKPLRF